MASKFKIPFSGIATNYFTVGYNHSYLGQMFMFPYNQQVQQIGFLMTESVCNITLTVMGNNNNLPNQNYILSIGTITTPSVPSGQYFNYISTNFYATANTKYWATIKVNSGRGKFYNTFIKGQLSDASAYMYNNEVMYWCWQNQYSQIQGPFSKNPFYIDVICS